LTDGDDICLIFPLLFFETFILLCFGVGLLNKSGEGIGINASFAVGGDSFWDVLGVMDCTDGIGAMDFVDGVMDFDDEIGVINFDDGTGVIDFDDEIGVMDCADGIGVIDFDDGIWVDEMV